MVSGDRPAACRAHKNWPAFPCCRPACLCVCVQLDIDVYWSMAFVHGMGSPLFFFPFLIIYCKPRESHAFKILCVYNKGEGYPRQLRLPCCQSEKCLMFFLLCLPGFQQTQQL